ncbi:MAG: adenine phosphoribosyltransferase [Sphingomonadales bacterium]
MDFKQYIRTIPDYPKTGIMFRDVTTLFSNTDAFKAAISALAEPFQGKSIDYVAGIEARGFILGGAVATALGAGFIPVRKQGKLPFKTIGRDYALEYGVDRVEIHVDAVSKGDKVLVVDDLIATGGTAEAAIALLQDCGAEVVAAAFVIDLPELQGKNKVSALGVPTRALCAFEGH